MNNGNFLMSKLKCKGVWLAAICAAFYPLILNAFHSVVSTSDNFSLNIIICLLLLLIAAISVPFVCMIIVRYIQPEDVAGRRFILFAVTTPTIYVFFGVLAYMADLKIPELWIWSPFWLLMGCFANSFKTKSVISTAEPSTYLRILHGICGALTTVFIIFHLFNHLFGLISPEAHSYVMDAGRIVYRSSFIEPLLVIALLFQIASGLRLMWLWSAMQVDIYRLVQIASGVFLAIFILGHMNSVFIFARTYLDIPTDWAFATGQPTGLIFDKWNIRLIPHYWLGVFFVLLHLLCGLRIVMIAHNISQSLANKFWWFGTIFSAFIATAILCGMVGLRLNSISL